ncbi:AMP-binding protein [Corynebacterium phocae]|uniref:AMP-binding protein n=1 Tax=Corynebacterium phocae TaxID=161895 RepID=UPI00123A9AE2|nr:AMP-binding protein [Corynebacterium phocae]
MRFGQTTLVDIFTATVAEFPARPACAGLSYSQLADATDTAAAHLVTLGVKPGDRVALALPNSHFHLIAFLAVLKLGAVVVEHNPQFTAPELEALFDLHGARLAIAWEGCPVPGPVVRVGPGGFDWPSAAPASAGSAATSRPSPTAPSLATAADYRRAHRQRR